MKDLDPTETLKRILNTLWNGPASSAPILLRKLADEMETLHKANDGCQFAPDLVFAIEESDVYSEAYDSIRSRRFSQTESGWEKGCRNDR